jgi:hypothetical protein
LRALITTAVFAVVFSSFPGCQSGTTGTFRPIDPAIATSLSNDIVKISSAAQAVAPFPWGEVAGGLGTAAIAILTAWQTATHKTATANSKAITALQNNTKV